MNGRFRVRLVALLCLCASGALAQYPAVRTTQGEVKRDADLNKPGAAKPSSSFARVPTQQGQVRQDSDWNKGSRAGIVTPALRFIGDAEIAPSFRSGAATARATADTVVQVRTGRLNFVGAGKE
jgi:hypothetical protein